MVLVDAAATAGILEPSDRLVPAIADAGRSWSNLASRWGDLAPPGARIQEPLARAAAEIRAAYRQITHDTTTPARPEVIAVRPGLPQAVTATLRAVEAASELAVVVGEKADNPNLIGPARTLSRRAHNDVDSGFVAAPPEGDVVWISPADILARRWVPIPSPVATALRAASATAAMTTSAASHAASLHLPPASIGSIPRHRRWGSESGKRAGWQPVGPTVRRGVAL